MANTLVVNAKNCEQEEYAVALHQVAALSAKPVVRPEQDPLPESSSKLAAHSHQRSAEHHVGLAPVVHKRSPSSVLGAHSEASQSTWSHRPSRTAAARHVTIQRVSVGLSNLPSHAKRPTYHVLVRRLLFVSPVQSAPLQGSPRLNGFHSLDYRSHRVGNKAECPARQSKYRILRR